MKEALGDSFSEFVESYTEEVGGITEQLFQLCTDNPQWSEFEVRSVQQKLHSIKGISGQIGLVSLSKIVHHVEDLISVYSKRSQSPPASLVFSTATFAENLKHFLQGLKDRYSEKQLDELLAVTLESFSVKKDAAKSNDVSRVSAGAVISDELGLSAANFELVFAGLSSCLVQLRLIDHPAVKPLRPQMEESLYSLVQARVTSLKGISARLKKLCRELSATLVKKVKVEVEGQDVSMDRPLVSALAEIMVHLVRNALDHGIESSEERRQVKKDESANLTVRFIVLGDRNVVEVQDDGRGIDPEVVAKKALEKGLVTQSDLVAMTNYEKQELIFLPNFSTKESATEVSGRGVGMDAVLSLVKKLSGKLTIDSDVGRGTKFRMEFPSPYQIQPTVRFSISGQFFTIPAQRVNGVCLSPNAYSAGLGAVTLNKTGTTLLNLSLPEIMAKPDKCTGPLIILSVDSTDICIAVDEIHGIGPFLIYQHTRPKGFPEYLSGIGFDAAGTPHFAFDLTEIDRNLNRYLEQIDVELPKNPIGENDYHSGKLIMPLPLLNKSIGDRKTILEVLEGDQMVDAIQSILKGLESQPATQNEVIKAISAEISNFKNGIADIEDPAELQYMAAMHYAQLKSKWIMLNIQMQYTSFAGKEPEPKVMYLASLYATVLGQIEPLSDPEAIKKIAQVLAEAMNK